MMHVQRYSTSVLGLEMISPSVVGNLDLVFMLDALINSAVPFIWDRIFITIDHKLKAT